MMDTDILDLLEDIGRSSVARLHPAVTLTGDTTKARREQVLRTIRGTVLPRRLEFTAANGDCLAIEVNSSRVTDVFRVRNGVVPDFETEARESLTGKLAQIVTDIAAAPGPLELISLQPDTALEADDVGITFSEISKACAGIEIPAEPVVSIVPDHQDAPMSDLEVVTSDQLAQQFYDASERFAVGRVLSDTDKSGTTLHDGVCATDQPAHADHDLLAQFAKDLNGWNADIAAQDDQPQLIVMRPEGGKGTALAVLKDGDQMALAVHEARKLGAVVNLWKSLTGSGK